MKSALPFLAITLFLLPASSWAEGIDPKIHKQCKDARDYTGCVKAFTPLPPTSDDELSALRAAMKQVAARITTGFALRDATLFFQPVTDQLALVRSSHSESSAVKDAAKASDLFAIAQKTWQARVNTLGVGFFTGMGPYYSCVPTKRGVKAFNSAAGSDVVEDSIKSGSLGFLMGCEEAIGVRHEAMMLSYIASLLQSGSISPEEIAAREKAASERRAQAERERKLCAMGPWNRYLEENPEIKKWSQANPATANATKEKFLANPKNQKDCSPVGN